MAYFWASVKDWKTWAFAIIYMGCDGSLYAFSLFLPSIVQQLYPGISSTRANLLSVPPYAGKCFTLEVEVGPHKPSHKLIPFLSCGHCDGIHRLACRPHQGPWTVQHQYFLPGHHWLCHATRCA
jgi:hypothetical protein